MYIIILKEKISSPEAQPNRAVQCAGATFDQTHKKVGLQVCLVFNSLFVIICSLLCA